MPHEARLLERLQAAWRLWQALSTRSDSRWPMGAGARESKARGRIAAGADSATSNRMAGTMMNPETLLAMKEATAKAQSHRWQQSHQKFVTECSPANVSALIAERDELKA